MRSAASIKSHPLHPMLVAFPIGLWVAAFCFDVVARMGGSTLLWSASFYCVVGGIVGGALAAVPGIIDYIRVVPPKSSGNRRALIHGGLNSLVLLAMIYVAFHRGGAVFAPDNIAFAIEGICVVLLGVSGWMGGTLVYRNQIAVDHRYANAESLKERSLPDWNKPLCHQSELSDGQMLLAKIGDQRVVVGRCPEGTFAFSDHCTHKGGPLHDGALIGCTVQCPWHGSQFDVRTGRVVAGPAEDKIDVFDVETRNGEIYVLPKKAAKGGKDKAA